MNILFLINYAGNAGTEKYVDNLRRLYSSWGHVCFLGYNVDGKLSETFKENRHEVLQLPLTSRDFFSSPKKLAKFCSDNMIDVIHTQYPVENIIAIKSLKYYSHPKVVLTRHLSDAQGLKWTLLNKIYTEKNHKIICVCDEAKDSLIRSGVREEKTEVIYNGIEYNPSPKENICGDIFRMIICARYAPEKGLDFLLKALSELKEKTSSAFECLILGEGEEFENIKGLISELRLESCVKQLGYRNDTMQFLRQSNLYLNSSRSGEAMSFAILEAMNEGLPVVATDVGGNSTLVSKGISCGRIVDFGNTKEYSDAVLEYINNPKMLYDDGKNANRKVKEQFDLVELARKVLDVYK